MLETCKFCGIYTKIPCMNTRDCEDSKNSTCQAALMLAGGGERTINQMISQNLEMEGKLPNLDDFKKSCAIIHAMQQEILINGRN